MPPPLSILFAGTSAFAVPSLKALAADPAYRIDLVITQPDRAVGRKQVLTAPPVKAAATELGFSVFQPEKLNRELGTLPAKTDRPDFLVVVSYGQILSQAILDLPRIMPINVHASLLPRWRGASPIQQAILAGDQETGVTVQKMVKELDAGPLLAQESTSIAPRESANTLHDRLAMMGADLLIQTLKKPLHPTEQDESEVTVCRTLTRVDGRVDPQTMTASEIDRRVRALTPWPGVTAQVDGQELKILETSLEPDARAASIDCDGNSRLYMLKVQAPGKKPVTGVEWERGKRM